MQTAAADAGGGQQQDREPSAPPTIERKTTGMQKLDGFVPLYWQEATGTLWMEIPAFDTELLYTTGLAAGLGSNDIGLDRGQGGGTHLVTFQRVGPKVFLVKPNTRHRVTSGNPDEERAVKEAFAQSYLWGFTVAAESGGRVLVDASDFLLRDVHGVTARLRPAAYRVDRARSAIYLPRTKAFPKNTEIEVTLTFVTDGPGQGGFGQGPGRDLGALSVVSPSTEAVTLRQHHSFVELPGPGYQQRAFDARAGFFGLSYQDYSAPLGNPMAMTRRFINRHRLEKKDPSAKISDPVKPIVYYVDRGAPEPIRTALVEGARYWNQAFDAAGYRNAFQVEVMPEGADPMDIRYNVIQWVSRSTRGWSTGAAVADPRTGEIIKGRVILDTLRMRQDYLLLEGLLSPYAKGDEQPKAITDAVLARIRQLSAHEVGHTLGLGHNYYDSTQGWTSVMDYPAPVVTLTADNRIDISNAYPSRIGEWDKVFIAYGYQHFPKGTDERKALDAILNDAWAKDLRYMTNQDVGINPRVDQWAHGTDPAAELARVMKVRRVALDRFGEAAIKRDVPYAQLEEVLMPLYLHQRYQVEVAASAVGGLHYIYGYRGDGREPVRPVPAAEQEAALTALLATLTPSELTLSAELLKKLPPRPDGYDRHRELFPRFTGDGFDPVSPAMVAANHLFSALLTSDRAARLVTQHATDPSLPGLDAVLQRLVTTVLTVSASTPYEMEIRRTLQSVLADRVMDLAGRAPMPQVRAQARWALLQMNNRRESDRRSAEDVAHMTLIESEVKRFLDRPLAPAPAIETPDAPPGAPIGDPGQEWLSPADVCRYWADADVADAVRRNGVRAGANVNGDRP